MTGRPAWKPPREKPHTSEANLQKACMVRWRMWGGMPFHPIGSNAQRSGEPDLIGSVRGRFVAVELKQPGKRPTPLQFKRLRDYRDAGGLVGWATTEVEFDAILAYAEDLAVCSIQPLDDPM